MARDYLECLKFYWAYAWIGMLYYLAPVVLVFMVLSGADPYCTLRYIYVPALNKSENSSTDPKIDFDIYLLNPNKGADFLFDAVNVTFYYPPNDVTSPIGNFSFPGFELAGGDSSTHLTNGVEVSGVPWAAARAAAAANGSAVFRVELATAVRFYRDLKPGKHKKHMVVFGSNVEVNDLGTKVNKYDVELHKSMGLHRPWWEFFIVVLAFVYYGCASFIIPHFPN